MKVIPERTAGRVGVLKTGLWRTKRTRTCSHTPGRTGRAKPTEIQTEGAVWQERRGGTCAAENWGVATEPLGRPRCKQSECSGWAVRPMQAFNNQEKCPPGFLLMQPISHASGVWKSRRQGRWSPWQEPAPYYP